jgi:hypothetical protein
MGDRDRLERLIGIAGMLTLENFSDASKGVGSGTVFVTSFATPTQSAFDPRNLVSIVAVGLRRSSRHRWGSGYLQY